MADAKILSEAMRGNIKLTKHIGDVWARTNMYFKDSDDDHTLREVELFMGCLKGNWQIIQGMTTEEMMQSCSTGNFTVGTGKPWRIGLNTRNMPAPLMAALTGMKIEEFYAGTTTDVLVTETKTLTAAAFATTGNGINLADEFTGAVYGDVIKILSVKRKGTNEWWKEAATAENDNYEYQWVDGDDVTYGEGANAPLLLFEDDTYNDDEFVVRIQYNRTITDGEYKMSDDGKTFPATFDMYLSWLVVVESGANKGRKGVMTAKLLNMMRTSEFTLGGDAQTIGSYDLEFAQNFEDDGDTEISFAWLDAAA